MEAGSHLVWYAGWLMAMTALVSVGLNIAVTAKRETGKRWIRVGLFGLANLLVIALAQYAIVKNDSHLDLTRTKAFTPHESAIELIESLDKPVAVTFFGHDDDPKAKRLRVVLGSLAKRSQLFSVVVTDLDKDPLLARRYNVNFYNIAVVEAAGRRVLVNTSNEVDIAIAIQKALRQRRTTICFVTGHGELEIDNDEFHTHVESLDGGGQNHNHGHAHIPVVQTTQHGVGRLRGSLETLGFVVSSLNLTADKPNADCATIAIINPRFPFLPSEITAIEEKYRAGTSLVVLLDLGSKLPLMNKFLAKEGIVINDNVVIDEKQHHEQDIETLAVSNYPAHVVTKNIAMTLFPGTRSIAVKEGEKRVEPLIKGSVYSYAKTLETHVNAAHSHGSEASHTHATTDTVENKTDTAEPVIVVIKESEGSVGKLLVGGDADFLSNSYLPYLSNGSLALSIFRWSVGEHDAVRTEPMLPVVQTIVMSQPQMQVLFVLLVGVLPLAVLVFGLFVWWKNRC